MGVQVMLTIMGIYMLARGKGWGKDAKPHDWYRFLGGFLITLYPATFACELVMGIIWAILHPNEPMDPLPKSLYWMAVGTHITMLVIYGVIAVAVESWIKRKIRLQEEKASAEPMAR